MLMLFQRMPMFSFHHQVPDHLWGSPHNQPTFWVHSAHKAGGKDIVSFIPRFFLRSWGTLLALCGEVIDPYVLDRRNDSPPVAFFDIEFDWGAGFNFECIEPAGCTSYWWRGFGIITFSLAVPAATSEKPFTCPRPGKGGSMLCWRRMCFARASERVNDLSHSISSDLFDSATHNKRS